MNPGNTSNYPLSSLYVGDLHPDVNESMLFEKFAAVGPVLSIIVCRDKVTRRSLGYAYVNFERPSDAEIALDTMNYDVLNGRQIRIMWSQRDQSLRKSGIGNVFISNLEKTVDSNILHDYFSIFGNILSCKVVIDESGNSKGYGFVHFETEEIAKRAIDKANGMILNGKNISVRKFTPRNKRGRGVCCRSRRNKLFVPNLDDNSPSGCEPLTYMQPEIGMGGGIANIPPSDFVMESNLGNAWLEGSGITSGMLNVNNISGVCSACGYGEHSGCRSNRYNYFVHNLSDDNSPSAGEPLTYMQPEIGMGGGIANIPPSDFVMESNLGNAWLEGSGITSGMLNVNNISGVCSACGYGEHSGCRSNRYNYFVHNLSDDNSPSAGEPLTYMQPEIGMGGGIANIPPSDFMMAGDYRGAQDYGIGVLDSMWDVEYGGVGPTNDCAADGPISPVSSGSDTDSCYCY